MNGKIFLQSACKQFRDYKDLADRSFAQIEDKDFHYKVNEVSNSLAVIITHMHGNMMSRWTHFLTEDGEKEWRRRDDEFEEQPLEKAQLLRLWEEGWATLFCAAEQLTEKDLDKTITIRQQPLSVMEAIHRQLTHYASHVGQIVFISKMIVGDRWQSLSIKKGASKQYNEQLQRKF